MGVNVPEGWSLNFSSELVPTAIRKTAVSGTVYESPETGSVLQKQVNGRWKVVREARSVDEILKEGSKSRVPKNDPTEPLASGSTPLEKASLKLSALEKRISDTDSPTSELDLERYGKLKLSVEEMKNARKEGSGFFKKKASDIDTSKTREKGKKVRELVPDAENRKDLSQATFLKRQSLFSPDPTLKKRKNFTPEEVESLTKKKEQISGLITTLESLYKSRRVTKDHSMRTKVEASARILKQYEGRYASALKRAQNWVDKMPVSVPEGWSLAFAQEVVPEAVRKGAEVGTVYQNPKTGTTLQKQPNGRWKKVSGGAPSTQAAKKPAAAPAPETKYPARKSDSITIGFGRFNPPTIGHKKLVDHIRSTAEAGNSDYNIFGSHSQDPKKNPLNSGAKATYLKEMFPEDSENIVYDPKVRNVLDALEGAYARGYKVANVVVGSDRLEEFKKLANKYNGDKYNFSAINVISAGDRDESAGDDDVSSMSASKMRAAVAAGDYSSFAKGIPDTLPPDRKKKLFAEIKAEMGV